MLHCNQLSKSTLSSQSYIPHPHIPTILSERPKYTMNYVFYCCQCRAGPMGTATHASCYNCSHEKCSSCDVYSEEEFAHNHEARGTNQDVVPGDRVLSNDCSSLDSLPSLGHTGQIFTCSHNNHGELTDGRDFRWTCCESFADNSYNHDEACWNCQGWRCNTCKVYEVIRK